MHQIPQVALITACIAMLAGCDDVALANDPEALAELRGTRSCIRAVEAETKQSGATANTTLPVVEVNQYVIDAADGQTWTCFTDDNNSATALVRIPSA